MPGETYQTLKSKATQQAKQSGMSQSAAESYGSAMATQSATQGQGGTSDASAIENRIHSSQFLNDEAFWGLKCKRDRRWRY